MTPLPPDIFLMGPTASGKNAVSLGLTLRLPLEIVSVDSAQVFRDMDIGTAKPDRATLAKVPHHLIDLISPEERYSAARFRVIGPVSNFPHFGEAFKCPVGSPMRPEKTCEVR